MQRQQAQGVDVQQQSQRSGPHQDRWVTYHLVQEGWEGEVYIGVLQCMLMKISMDA